jgi:hypothetical protein
MVHIWLAMSRRLGLTSTLVGAASGGALVPGMTSVAAAVVTLLPPSGG